MLNREVRIDMKDLISGIVRMLVHGSFFSGNYLFFFWGLLALVDFRLSLRVVRTSAYPIMKDFTTRYCNIRMTTLLEKFKRGKCPNRNICITRKKATHLKGRR